MTLTCSEARSVLLSPVADAEKKRLAQQHVLTCGECGAVEGQGQPRLLIGRVSEGRVAVRTVLALLGLVELSLALPWLVGSASWWQYSSATADQHLTRDGMIALVLGCAALFSAWSRRFAFFSVVPAAIALAVQLLTVFVDRSGNNVSFGFEWIHLLGIAVIVLLAVEVRAVTKSGPFG